MSHLKQAQPSPAIVIAVIALVAALSGTALAGPDLVTRKVTKQQVKKVAKKQADKQITKRAPGLSVASSARATDADALGGEPPSAFQRSGHLATASVVSPATPGTVLLSDPRTGARIEATGAGASGIRIVNTSASRHMRVAGVSNFATTVEGESVSLSPGASANFFTSGFASEYLDLAITLGGPTASEAKYSHLTCSSASGGGSDPSMLSCILVG